MEAKNQGKRLVIISNRLPYQVQEKGKQISIRQSSGGLVSAIKGYIENSGSGYFSSRLWVGYPGTSEEKWNRVMAGTQPEGDFEVAPVFIPDKIYDQYYNGFSNSVIWPLFHYFPSYAVYKQEYFDSYKKVNELFAEKLSQVIREDDVVWVHDYHLFLLPGLLRKTFPDLSIGYFLHIPFPGYEIFRLLPRRWKEEILEGLLGADLLGFHTIEYKRYFLEALQMGLNVENDFGRVFYQNRVIGTDLFPIGIDYDKFDKAWQNPEVVRLRTALRQNFAPLKIIFSLDRLDYTKGVMQRLNGYRKFLETFPEWREKIVMILNVIPSRDKVFKYSERKKMIEERVSGINGRFSTYTWQPIVYFYKHLDFENLAALYQASDLALVTPLRDGMNLVSKEYVASHPDRRGVLILSELAGASNELGEALQVNPIDESGIATAILDGLEMPEQVQEEKMILMQKRLREYDVNRWVEDFLSELDRVKQAQEARKSVLFDRQNCSRVMQLAESASRRLLFFDYDGTLMPFARYPTDAAPNSEVLEKLDILSRDHRNTLVVISGRDRDTLESWLGHLPVVIVAEHGALIRHQGRKWEILGQPAGEWKPAVLPTMELFTRRCNGSFIEEKQFSLAWHYRNVQSQLGFSRSRELLQNLTHTLANTPLQVIDGNKVVEVRTANSNKGIVARMIAEETRPDFILAVGDDKTDEDMFKSLAGMAVTIKIGSGNTVANYSLPYQSDVPALLEKLISLNCN